MFKCTLCSRRAVLFMHVIHQNSGFLFLLSWSIAQGAEIGFSSFMGHLRVRVATSATIKK